MISIMIFPIKLGWDFFNEKKKKSAREGGDVGLNTRANTTGPAKKKYHMLGTVVYKHCTSRLQLRLYKLHIFNSFACLHFHNILQRKYVLHKDLFK